MRRSPARHAPPQYPIYPPQPMQPYYPPAPIRASAIDRFLNMAVWILVIGLGLFAAYLLLTPPASIPAPATAPAAPAATRTARDTTTQDNSQLSDTTAYNATAAAEHQAAITAADQEVAAVAPAAAPAAPAAVVPNVNDPATWPTAIILIATAIPVEQVTVVPLDVPLVVAEGSDMRPTPVAVMPFPTPLPAAIADNFTLSPDGLCISAPRGGKRYQVCQAWKYAPQEMATVADLIRGGTLPGVEVAP